MNKDTQESPGETALRVVRAKSTGLLLEELAGSKESTLTSWISRYELERRKNKWNEIRSWITIGLSVVALVISIFSLIK